MRDEYDFSKAKRSAAVPSPGKTRIAVMLDDDVIEHFRALAEAQGVGYQTSINALLRTAIATTSGVKFDPAASNSTAQSVSADGALDGWS
jgi:hypothetical protein